MKNNFFSETYNKYLVQPSPATLLYAAVASGCSWFLGIKGDSIAYQIIAAFVTIVSLLQVYRYFRPPALLIGSSKLRLPKMIPGDFKDIFFNEIDCHWQASFKGEPHVYIRLKSGKIFDYQVSHIKPWPAFYQEICQKIPSGQNDFRTEKVSVPRLVFIGAIVILILLVAVKVDFINFKTGVMCAIASSGFILLSFVRKSR